jgi:hypothetical protein
VICQVLPDGLFERPVLSDEEKKEFLLDVRDFWKLVGESARNR